MAFNKSKALENALKFLNQGKVPQAIAEYQQILRNDPKDQATLMTVGDLYARQGDMSHAIEYFERLAQVYLNDGFNSKAIAIYKKIAKLAPNELAPLERLADLYVQQGVLSEARPLFLQIAEAHLKANHAQRAVEVLHRLLEVEPENLRVQMRLAELYNVMGQKKEAAQTYLTYAQRLLDHGEHDEAYKLVERALEVDPTNGAALLLRVKALMAGGKHSDAGTLLESHPEANAGGEVTAMLLDMEIKSGQLPKAADRARKQLARGHQHTAPLYSVVDAMIAGGQAMEALPILEELRHPTIEAGEQDKYLKAISAIVEKQPAEAAPLELMVDFCRYTSNSHQLPLALSQLADLCASRGNYTRAEECLQELIDRNKDDERLVERLNQLRAKSGQPAGSAPETKAAEPPPRVDEHEKPAPIPPPAILEETYDEETQKYIAQALTDVDLFSSYGLTQKATHLLENVLQRAPRHTPTLERLLDLHLGAGNERRTAELASQLEQIHRERNDTVNADRFLELRQRFQQAAGMAEDELPAAPPLAAPPAAAAPVVPEAQASIESAPVAAEPPAFEVAQAPVAQAPSATDAKFQEFEISLVQPEAEATPEQVSAPAPAAPPADQVSEAPPASVSAATPAEVDLSDEWEAMIQDVAETATDKPVAASSQASESAQQPAAVEEVASAGIDATPVPNSASAAPELSVAQSDLDEPAPAPSEPEVLELQDIVAEEMAEGPEPSFELVEESAAEPSPAAEPPAQHVELAAEPSHSGSHDFELELTQASSAARPEPATTEDFISDLVAEIDGLDAPSHAAPPEVVAPASLSKIFEQEPEPVAAVSLPPVAGPANGSAGAPPVPQVSAESLNQLSEVFQEFRAELGELGEEDEDLETHYNLGIAYREMGLLDEAIGEFQKVAKAVQKGKPFRYSMNCATMLGLCFMDKGEPKVASMWYQRALESPGLEQEAVLALRYDLGMALENAGESKQALDSFRQVYAMNIDYRDVADRIAELQKH
ncbi:MAG TPA: tetratricopeptide repeat protein [Candidatus Acidoferrum sp.]|nr:tetratricopeptide repeat protein [Candidatus Acidoferrum sp.]